jgi:hypothetical protein
MPARFVYIVLLSILLPAAAVATPGTPSLCSAEEVIVVSCRAGPKLASVCALHAASGELLYAQYRFGRPGNPEITIPSKYPFDASLLRGEVTTGTHGGWEGLSIQNGDVVYTIEHSWDRGQEDADITVSRRGQRLKTFSCKPIYTGDGRDAEGLRGFISANHLEALEPGTTAQ